MYCKTSQNIHYRKSLVIIHGKIERAWFSLWKKEKPTNFQDSRRVFDIFYKWITPPSINYFLVFCSNRKHFASKLSVAKLKTSIQKKAILTRFATFETKIKEIFQSATPNKKERLCLERRECVAFKAKLNLVFHSFSLFKRREDSSGHCHINDIIGGVADWLLHNLHSVAIGQA